MTDSRERTRLPYNDVVSEGHGAVDGRAERAEQLSAKVNAVEIDVNDFETIV